MEKRIGSALIMIEETKNVSRLNQILTQNSDIIIGRQGLPLRDKGISLISLVLEGTTDEIGALTGQVGRLEGLQIKSVLTKNKNNKNENSF